MKEKIIRLVSSFFYLGYFPFIPGTMGSLGGVLVYLLVKDNFYFYSAVLVFIGIVGFTISHKAEELFGRHDCPKIVIDEVVGMLVSLLLIPPKIPLIVLGFIFFRAFDTIKPPPFDRLQKLPGSLGIMSDDLGAGIYTNFTLRIIAGIVGL
ncbi:MAG: phosphatidylglycerophosphatase A [Candidatus Omnitrophota bacterium]